MLTLEATMGYTVKWKGTTIGTVTRRDRQGWIGYLGSTASTAARTRGQAADLLVDLHLSEGTPAPAPAPTGPIHDGDIITQPPEPPVKGPGSRSAWRESAVRYLASINASEGTPPTPPPADSPTSAPIGGGPVGPIPTIDNPNKD